MPNMAEMDDVTAWVHLLMIGQTKTGKSTYIAQAAKDGHKIIYLDSDNGFSALRSLLPVGHPARANVEYIGTDFPFKLLNKLMTESVLRWNLTQDAPYTSGSGVSGDKVLQIVPSKIPPDIILAVDSWSTIAYDCMELGMLKKGAAVLSELKQNDAEGMFGEAQKLLNPLLFTMQKSPFHTIVLGHPTFYERYEKPDNAVGNVARRDMTLKETIEVVVSSSRPHGYTMGKFFTDIGWLEIDRFNKRILDFNVKHGRMSGGTRAIKGEVDELSFSKIFGAPKDTTFDASWIRNYTHDEFIAEKAVLAATKQAAPAGVARPVIPAVPVKPVLAGFNKA